MAEKESSDEFDYESVPGILGGAILVLFFFGWIWPEMRGWYLFGGCIASLAISFACVRTLWRSAGPHLSSIPSTEPITVDIVAPEVAAQLRRDDEELKRRSGRDMNIATMLGIASPVLPYGGYAFSSHLEGTFVPLAMIILGPIVSIVGASYLAAARSRSRAWGVLSIFAYGVLLLLPDLTAQKRDELKWKRTGRSGSFSMDERNRVVACLAGFIVLVPLLIIYGPKRERQPTAVEMIMNGSTNTNPSLKPTGR